ncbi:hypothetical protein, partial [Fulvimarina sp. MAC8]|uniref:hypothetical protein n=1 Tax=Fulvimarina sp. MAC8 TaxID=3162874 RepID=UPI0032ECCBDC
VKGARIVCPHRATLNQNVIFLMKSVNEETGALPRKRVRSSTHPSRSGEYFRTEKRTFSSETE